MQYKLSEEYFQTPKVQKIAQEYFDTVLSGLLNYKELIHAKGLFIRDGEVKVDNFDMPYHVHILNGLIPTLLIYEKILIDRDLLKFDEAELYIKALILGYTFHDANKLFEIDDWGEAINTLDKEATKLGISDFIKEFDTYKDNVYYLILNTEDRSSVLGNEYSINLDERHMSEILAPLCHFADEIASIQELDGVETMYTNIEKSIGKILHLIGIQTSYVKIQPNPYTLLSQNLIQTARKVLKEKGKDIFYIMRDGFIYFGEDVTTDEKAEIAERFSGESDDINFVGLTKVDAQSCNFGFLGTIDLTADVLDKIIEEIPNKFLLLSPNGPNTISDFQYFVRFNELLIEKMGLSVNVNMYNEKLYLNFEEELNEEQENFVRLFALHKMKWLNTKANKAWNKEFKDLAGSDALLPVELEVQLNDDEAFELAKYSDIKEYLGKITKSTNALLKTYLALFKSYEFLLLYEDEEELKASIEDIKQEIVTAFSSDSNGLKPTDEMIERYINFKGFDNSAMFEHLNPSVPKKKEMCAFTGQKGTVQYEESIAFGLKARGFSNRTVTSLKNTTSHVTKLMAEENKLRQTYYKAKASNTVVYYDFFESALDIDTDVFSQILKARKIDKDKKGNLVLDKATKLRFSYNKMEFIELSGKMKNLFRLVRNHLMILKKLQVRTFITNIMSPYRAHKEAFVFENAPHFLRVLGWDKVRLNNVDSVLEEIDLLYSIAKRGTNINNGIVLHYAADPHSIFKAYYELEYKDEQSARFVKNRLIDFVYKHPQKFTNMTTMENLVDVALKIDSSAKSGSDETWLIRTGLDYLRKNIKEGRSKEDTIQQIGAEIYRKKHQDYNEPEVIQQFARMVYEELYEKEWNGKLPIVNRQKDWIYQFGFLFKIKVTEKIKQFKTAKIERQLEEQGLEKTEDNIRTILEKENLDRYADQYIKQILG